MCVGGYLCFDEQRGQIAQPEDDSLFFGRVIVSSFSFLFSGKSGENKCAITPQLFLSPRIVIREKGLCTP